MKTNLKLAAALLLLSTLNSSLPTAFATTNLVYNNNDAGPGSLRQVIQNSSSSDIIIFSNVVTGTISLTSGELLLSNKNLAILGPGANVLAVSGNAASRVFHLSNTITTISGLTLSNGVANASSSPPNSGGGIYNVQGTLTVSNCAFRGNSAAVDGGGIFNYGNIGNVTLSVVASTFSGNSASFGGAVFNAGLLGWSAPVSLTLCTFSGNSATVSGGGIVNDGDNNGHAPLSVIGCTFSGNSATNGACVYNSAAEGGNASLTIGDTILKAGTLSPNLYNSAAVNSQATVNSLGYNLSSDGGSGYLTATGDQLNTDPMLGPLQDNGGPTQTMLPVPGSPAIDQGMSFGLTTDQRGRPRPFDYPGVPNATGGDGSDIGAVELNPGTLVVVNTNDSGAGSLRQAILDTSAANDYTISFAPGLAGTIGLTRGEIGIGTSLFLLGPGASVLAVSGNNASRVFNISNGVVNISGLAIRDGRIVGVGGRPGLNAFGGGLFCATPNSVTLTECVISNCAAIGGAGFNNLAGSGFAGGSGYCGGVYNILGSLTVDRCWVVGNTAAGGNGGGGGIEAGATGGNGGSGYGGGVMEDGTGHVTLSASTISSNLAVFGRGGSGPAGNGADGSAGGGGLYDYLGPVIAFNCTFASNAVNGAGTGAGGGIDNFGGGAISLLSCTVAGNNGDSLGGGVYGGGAVTSSIIADNSATNAPDVSGTFTSGGYNLIGNTSGSAGFGATGDQLNVNPLLGALQYNGGPTPTMALLPGSPAIDQGNSFGLTVDQRGFARPFDFPSIPNAADGSDIGAFEVGPPILNITFVAPTNVVLSWLAYDNSFTAKAVAALSVSNNWTAVPGTQVLLGNQYFLTNPATVPQKFYRLSSP